MGKVPLPPSTTIIIEGQGTHLHEDCLEFDDILFILFEADGFLDASASAGIFQPDIPSGYFPIGNMIGPFRPLQDDTQFVLTFFDTDNNTFYFDTICIKDDCSKGCSEGTT